MTITATATTLEDAQREAVEAAARVSQLEERVREGDPDVTPKALDDARSLAGYAQLRVDAARRAGTRSEAEQRHAGYRRLAERARHIAGIADEPLGETYREALAATRRLYELAAERDETVREIYEAIRQAIAEAQEHGDLHELAATGLLSVDGWRAAFSIRDAGGQERTTYGVLGAYVASAPLAAVLEEARQQSPRGLPFDPALWEVPNQYAAQAFREIPALASASNTSQHASP